ncbi:Peptidyl-prolyl cis-trans isomerase D [Bienertia sinuspersici]
MGSINLCLELQKDLKDLLFDGSNLEKEDSDLFRFVSTLDNPKGVLEHSSNFKDEGNSSFKEGDFENALEKYSLSCVFLSCLDVQEEDTRSSFSHLASIVILNMAASLLKKKEFEHVGQLCSIVLNYNPKNVKALFRRANVAIGLGEYELACWDLRIAQETESSNQEVGRKLKEVEQILHARLGKCNVHGKKKRQEERLQEASKPIAPIDDAMANEKVSNQYERENSTCNDIVISNMMEVDKRGGRAIENDTDRVKETPSTKEVVMSDQEKTEGVRVIGMARKKKVDRSKVHFQNRRKPDSGLTISRRDYQLLAKGRTVQHFNPRLGIVMSIRILGTPQEHSYKISESHTHQTPQSSPRHQGELFHHKGVDDSATHDVIEQSERNLVREISPSSPEKVTKNYPSEVTSMLTMSPSYPPYFVRSPFCLPTSATSNRSISFQSTPTRNGSLARRTRNRGSQKGATRAPRINRRNPTCVLANHGFHCRLKIEAKFKQDDYPLPKCQNQSSFRSGMKRKFALIQTQDLPQQIRKLVITKNEKCKSCSMSVLSFSYKLGTLQVVRIASGLNLESASPP